MINIGKINKLKVSKQLGQDIYVEGSDTRKILLADKKLPAHYQTGDDIQVFVYVDSEGHLAATTQIPFAQVDQFAWLKVVSINYYGAFLDWGLPKNLLVPFGEQLGELQIGEAYLVRLYLDDKGRIAATLKIEQFIADEVDETVDLQPGQKVTLLIANKTELGFKAIVNHSHWGLLYQNEIFQPLAKGQSVDGYIKQIRADNKIDLTLNQHGYTQVVDPLAQQILNRLKATNGVLFLSDKSSPDAIYREFSISKKVFKQSIGSLYKQQLITIEKDFIKLN